MARANISKKSVEQSANKKKEWPLVIYIWMIGMGFLSYAVGRIALNAYPHPYHWASGLAGGAIGLLVGWVWYKKRGDIS
jgi:hypothetical protein